MLPYLQYVNSWCLSLAGVCLALTYVTFILAVKQSGGKDMHLQNALV